MMTFAPKKPQIVVVKYFKNKQRSYPTL